MILTALGIVTRPRSIPAYAASWKVLRNDTSAVFTAASKAQAAVDWMHARQPSKVLNAAA